MPPDTAETRALIELAALRTDWKNLTDKLADYIEQDRSCKEDYEHRLRTLEGKQSYGSGVVAGVALVSSLLGGVVVAVLAWGLGRF
jgi:mannitol/fructose-specific phosphotransferase system IIA component (Ntr-type)